MKGCDMMVITFPNEKIASDFFNKIVENYTEDIVDPYEGKIDWYLTNFYTQPIEKYESKYYNKNLYDSCKNDVVYKAQMFYMFDVFGIQDPLYIDIVWDDNKILIIASHETIKQYEEIIYNTFLPYYVNNNLFMISERL